MAMLAGLLAIQSAGVQAQPAGSPAAITLPTTPRDLATQCYWATAAGIVGSKNQTAVVADAVWYLIEYLRTDSAAGDTMAQIQAMSSEPAVTMDEAYFAKAPAVVEACRKRFPRSRAGAAVKLPTDAFDRDVLCLGVASLLFGFADGERKDTGKSDFYAPADTMMNRLYARLDDPTLAAHGYKGDAAVTALVGSALRKSSTYGNLLDVFTACGTAIPG